MLNGMNLNGGDLESRSQSKPFNFSFLFMTYMVLGLIHCWLIHKYIHCRTQSWNVHQLQYATSLKFKDTFFLDKGVRSLWKPWSQILCTDTSGWIPVFQLHWSFLIACRYHRHAAGQMYALSRALAQYISINRYVAYNVSGINPWESWASKQIIIHGHGSNAWNGKQASNRK